MNLLQRAWVRLTARVVPEYGRVIKESGGVRYAAAAIREANSLIEEWHQVRNEGIRELAECEAIKGPGPGSAALKERFWELELALEDRGWKRQMALSALEFSRYGIQQLMLISRLYFIKNPLIKRGVKISAFYIFGRGYQITAQSKGATDPAANDTIQEFLKANENELGHVGLVEKDQTLRTDGNLFFVFFTRESDGQTIVRTIDAVEIMDVVTDPDDASVPWYYRRMWQAEQFDVATGERASVSMDAWYPALNYEPLAKPASIAGKPVLWKQPVYHVKTGGLPKWKFGCPETYASIDWARAYKRFLENWAAITDALARFAWNVETKGGQQAISAFSAALSTTLGDNATAIETNPPATTASSFVTGPGNKLTPVKTAGATTEPEQGRRVLLMVAASDGLPETFYGDASTGSLATAQSLDRPTELQFLERQELWRSVLKNILQYVLQVSTGAPRGKLREASADLSAIDIIVDFPAILEHDIAAAVGAIVAGTTLNGYQPAGTVDVRTAARLILKELGVDNIDTVLDAMYPPDEYDAKQEEDEPAAPAPVPPAPNVAIPAARMAEAASALLRASERLRGLLR